MARFPKSKPSETPFDARDDDGLDELYETVLQLKDVAECRRFFVDLCTPAELHSLRDRWRVARLVSQGFPYREIHELTGVSTATITRVGRTLNYGTGGYQALLERSRRRTVSKSRKLRGANGRKGPGAGKVRAGAKAVTKARGGTGSTGSKPSTSKARRQERLP